MIPLVLLTATCFSSDTVTFKGEHLALKGHVSIDHPIGTVTSDEAEVMELTESSFVTAILRNHVELFFKEDRLVANEVVLDNKNEEVLAKGPTTFFGSKEAFSLFCDGAAEFKKNSMQLNFIPKEAPILFEHGTTAIRSSSAFVEFQQNEPTTLVFENNVQLTNGSIKGSADRLVYHLKEGSLEGIGKVSFVLNREEADRFLELWKKKPS